MEGSERPAKIIRKGTVPNGGGSGADPKGKSGDVERTSSRESGLSKRTAATVVDGDFQIVKLKDLVDAIKEEMGIGTVKMSDAVDDALKDLGLEGKGLPLKEKANRAARELGLSKRASSSLGGE
mmetsp:Transcript_32619/g.55894  ORF Transcript_32619/g.55894 Transcript_32619/m.55894 type:complete len:124 (-) Transcript_32619:47-418(-)